MSTDVQVSELQREIIRLNAQIKLKDDEISELTLQKQILQAQLDRYSDSQLKVDPKIVVYLNDTPSYSTEHIPAVNTSYVNDNVSHFIQKNYNGDHGGWVFTSMGNFCYTINLGLHLKLVAINGDIIAEKNVYYEQAFGDLQQLFLSVGAGLGRSVVPIEYEKEADTLIGIVPDSPDTVVTTDRSILHPFFVPRDSIHEVV